MKTTIGSKMNLLSIVAMIVIVAALLPDVTYARPSGLISSSRQKRVSDQRVAELETLLALARMRGKLVTVPVGFGRVDPARIGRRRRSSEESGLAKLKRLLQAVPHDSESAGSEDRDEILLLPSSWNEVEDRSNVEVVDQLD